MGVVKLTPTGQAKFINQYVGSSGETAYRLMQASDGNLYTINWEGVGVRRMPAPCWSRISLGNSSAAVYDFGTPSNFGSLTFNADTPNAPIVEGADDALYMTTSGERSGFNACQGYGVNNVAYCQPVPAASMFRFDPSGGGSTICNFTSLSDGTTPYTGLTPGSAGNLYGVANARGNTNPECYTGGLPSTDPWRCNLEALGNLKTTISDEGCGTVFRVTPTGVYTPMYTSATGRKVAPPRHGNPPLAFA